MKLRSGKIIPSGVSALPKELEDKLENKLKKFKTLFASNPEHAKELLNIISKARSIEIRFNIREKIEEVYNNNELPGGNGDLMGAAGELAWFLVYNPQYQHNIEKRIKSFDLEVSVLGNVEENNMEF